MKTGASFKANLPKEHQILIHIRKVWDRIIRLETASTTICTMTPGTSIMRSHLYQPLSPNAPWLPMFWRRRDSRKVPMDLVESGSSRSSSKSGSVLLVTSAPRELKIWWPCMVDSLTRPLELRKLTIAVNTVIWRRLLRPVFLHSYIIPFTGGHLLQLQRHLCLPTLAQNPRPLHLVRVAHLTATYEWSVC